MRMIIAAVVIIAILAGAYFYFTKYKAPMETDQTASGVEIPEGPVARVNGVEVTGEKYGSAIAELAQNATAQGADMNDPNVQNAIAQEALTIVVNTELLVQAAEAAGHAASEEAVQTEYDAIVTQVGGEEAFTAALASVALTDTELRSNIKDQIAIRAFIDASVDVEGITVTDEEVQALYDQAAASGVGELPPLADIKPQVEAQVRATKEQELVAAFIESLKGEADIEVLI